VDDVDNVAVNAALLFCTTIPSKRLIDKLRNCCSSVAESLSAVSVLGIVRTLSGLWSAKNNQLTFFLFIPLADARLLLFLCTFSLFITGYCSKTALTYWSPFGKIYRVGIVVSDC